MLTDEQLKNLAFASCAAKEVEWETGFPKELSLGQWALESGWGEHQPANNCFGIKAYDGCAGTQDLETTEVFDGVPHRVTQTFAKFDTLKDCFQKHASLLMNGRYLDDWAAFWAGNITLYTFIERVGMIYATDPRYAGKVDAILNMPQVQGTLYGRQATGSGTQTGIAQQAADLGDAGAQDLPKTQV